MNGGGCAYDCGCVNGGGGALDGGWVSALFGWLRRMVACEPKALAKGL